MLNKSYYILFISLLLVQSAFSNNNEKIIAFHIDFNSVSLNKQYVFKWLEKVSEMGYNSILWEIEDDLKWDTCPECASPDAFTKEEFKEILSFSRALGLEPIPLLQTIGHGEYVLQHEQYFAFREDSTRYDCYCTSNEEVKSFLRKWIEEYLEVFGDIKYFHLGGDEAYAFGTCSKCKQTAEREGENKLYIDHLNSISEPLFKRNIRPGIWSDMILSNPKQINLVPKSYVVWDWNYWDNDTEPDRVMVWGRGRITKEELTEELKDDFPEIIDEFGNLVPFYTADMLNRLGYDVILSSTSRSHGDGVFIGRNNLHMNNIYGAAKKTVELNLLGTCVTSWAVRIPNYETQEPWLHIAPMTINNPALTKVQILEKISDNLFGLKNLEIYDVIEKIGHSFPFVNTNTTGIMWTGLKDSKTAPKDYIKNYIDRKIKQNQWEEYINPIENSSFIINNGIQKLNTIISASTKGYEILFHFSKGALFNYWHSILASEIISRVEFNNRTPDKEIVSIIEILKKDYIEWAKDWMTEESAKLNAGLIYDAIQNYFQN